jgi:2-isopropylmalate synthase
VRQDRYGVDSSIKLDQLYPTSEVLGNLITFRPSPNKAVVGANAFAHESGIHQHGMLANPLCYEIMTPQLVGVARTHLILGKHSGRAALRHRLEQLGYTLTRDELQHVYYRFVALADRKKNIYDQDLVGLLPDQIRERKQEPVAELD